MLARKARCSQDVYWVIKQRCRGNNSGDRSQMRARGLAANPNFGKVECFCGEGLTPILAVLPDGPRPARPADLREALANSISLRYEGLAILSWWTPPSFSTR